MKNRHLIYLCTQQAETGVNMEALSQTLVKFRVELYHTVNLQGSTAGLVQHRNPCKNKGVEFCKPEGQFEAHRSPAPPYSQTYSRALVGNQRPPICQSTNSPNLKTSPTRPAIKLFILLIKLAPLTTTKSLSPSLIKDHLYEVPLVCYLMNNMMSTSGTFPIQTQTNYMFNHDILH